MIVILRKRRFSIATVECRVVHRTGAAFAQRQRNSTHPWIRPVIEAGPAEAAAAWPAGPLLATGRIAA
ncbi:hypothetical protein [Luteimonas mephitis]|uniref:hypothetical protein n=1 Tax=Luteimonas mephitis TaxID=83615 RepID=UPI0012EB6FB7|nr:hypothetical protein [Luteimonas mephitis]